MKRLTLFFFCSLISFFELSAQQDLGLHFMDNIIQSTQTNPAKFSNYGVNIALVSPHVNIYNAQFSPNNIFSENGNRLSLNSSRLLAALDETKNYLQANVALHSLTVGLRYDYFQLTLSHAMKMGTYLNYPKGIASLLFEGNGNRIGETIDIAPQIDVLAYQEFGIGLAFQVNEILSVGTKLKYLMGVAALHTDRSSATLHTDENYYELTGQTDVVFQSSGLTINDDGDIELFGGTDNISNALFTNNSGYAIDLGAVVTLGKRFSFKASVLDLGQIIWKNNVSTQTSRGTHRFEGVAVGPMIENDSFDLRSVVDTLEQVFNFTETERSFATSLPGRFYLSARFSPIDGLHLGALAYGEIFRKRFQPALALNVQKDFGDILSIGAMYSVRNRTFDNIGLNFTLRLIGIQIFGVTDNIIPLLDPMKTKSTNFRFGLNLAFGNKKEKKRSRR